MRQRVPPRAFPGSPRLLGRAVERGIELWTETVGSPPPVYGERWMPWGERTVRQFEPSRSKLAAGIARGWRRPIPSAGERWLYLGAGSGTTASHVADLVGPGGTVHAVEKSPRTFARLLALARRWPNLLPVLADVRDPGSYADLVPDVDGVYADVAQPDQVALVRENAELFLGDTGGAVVIALKTSSLGRDLAPSAHLARAEHQLADRLRLEASVRLDPIHRGHYLLGGRWTGATPGPRAGAPTPRREPRRGRRPR